MTQVTFEHTLLMIGWDLFNIENLIFLILILSPAASSITLTMVVIIISSIVDEFSISMNLLITTVEAFSYVVLTSLLVILYKRQTAISDSQREVQKNQLEISRYKHAPDLSISVVDYNLKTRIPYLEIKIKNNGKGPIQNFWSATDLEIKHIMNEGQYVGERSYVSPTAQNIIETSSADKYPKKLPPGESIRRKVQFLLSVRDMNNGGESIKDSAPVILLALSKKGVGSVQIRFVVGGRDIFGMRKNPVTGPYKEKIYFALNIDYNEMDSLTTSIGNYIDRSRKMNQM